MRSRLGLLLAGGLVSGCSLLGGVTGDYTLGRGDGTGGAGGTGTGSGGGIPAFSLVVSSEQEAVITGVISMDSQLFVSGWFRGASVTVGEVTEPSPSSDPDSADAFLFHVDTSGQVDRLVVFGDENDDTIESIAMLPGGQELVAVGSCCSLAAFVPGGTGCNFPQPRACVVKLAQSDFLVLDADQYGIPGSVAKEVVVRDPDGDPELLVAGEMHLSNSGEVLPNCDNVSDAGGSTNVNALGIMAVAPDTLACQSGVVRWGNDDQLNGMAVDPSTSRAMITGLVDPIATLPVTGDKDVGYVFTFQDNAVTPGGYAWWDGAGVDIGNDVVATGDQEQFIVLGGITEDGSLSAGEPLDPVPPSIGSALVARVDASTDPVWATQLSTNVGSDAAATAAEIYGAALLVVGTFKGPMRAFSDTIRLDAIGEQDMFLAQLDVTNGNVNAAVGFGAPGAIVEPSHIQILESSPVVAGHLQGSLETPSGTISCPSASVGCAFLVRLEGAL